MTTEDSAITPGAREGDAPVRDRLTTTLFLAALFHGIVILGITFAAPISNNRPTPTLEVLLVVAAVAVAVVAPSIGLLFVLQQRGRLEVEDA